MILQLVSDLAPPDQSRGDLPGGVAFRLRAPNGVEPVSGRQNRPSPHLAAPFRDPTGLHVPHLPR